MYIAEIINILLWFGHIY